MSYQTFYQTKVTFILQLLDTQIQETLFFLILHEILKILNEIKEC